MPAQIKASSFKQQTINQILSTREYGGGSGRRIETFNNLSIRISNRKEGEDEDVL